MTDPGLMVACEACSWSHRYTGRLSELSIGLSRRPDRAVKQVAALEALIVYGDKRLPPLESSRGWTSI